MDVLAWLVIGSAVLLVATVIVAVLCACVAAGRADDRLDGFSRLASVGDPAFRWGGVDDVDFDWPEQS
jgi:hypothetical protein